MSTGEEITVTLTRDEAEALLGSWTIDEFPSSNPWGRKGPILLKSAELKVQEALDEEKATRAKAARA